MQATKAGIVHAVTFNYRGNPLVQQARQAIARGDIGTPHFVHRPLPAGLAAQGHRLLVAPRAGQGRRVVGARRHRLALVRSGAAHQRPAHHRTCSATSRRSIPKRKKPRGIARGVRGGRRRRRRSRRSTSRSRISRRCCCGSTTARRAASRSGRCAPATRTISCSRFAARRRRCAGGRSIRTSCGSATATRPNEILQKDPSLLDAEARALRAPAGRPPGIVGRRVLQRDARHLRRSSPRARSRRDPHPPAFATFEDGYRANCIVEAILESAEARRSVWTKVERRGVDAQDSGDDMTIKPFEPKFMKVGVLTAALQELTPREVRDPDPDRAIEEWVAFAKRAGRRATSSCRRRCIRPRPTCRPRRCSIRSRTRSICGKPFDKDRARRVEAALDGQRHRHLRRRLLRQHAAPRSGDPAEEARLHAARVRRGGAARRRCRLRLRRPQPAAQHGPEPRRLRAAVRAAAQGGEGARPDLPRRAVPDARLDDRRQLAQQHRLHARGRGSRCTASARSTASAISSAFTTTRRTRS